MAQSIVGTNLAANWAASSARPAVRVRCDWNKDGDYGDAYEDITSRVISVSLAHRLYDQLSGLPLLGTAPSSSAQVVVANETRWFSPDNASGLAGTYAGLANGIWRIPIQIDMGYYDGATAEYLVQFQGEIEGADESETHGEASVTFGCTDNSIVLLQDKVSTGVYEGYRPDSLIAVLLVLAGLLSYDLDRAMSEVPYAWLDDENLWAECLALAGADGGMFFFSKGGTPTFRRMTAPLERADGLTAVATLDQGNTVALRDSIAWRDTYSGVIAEWAGRYPGPVVEVWRAPRPIAVEPGKTITEEARLRYPTLGIVSPVYDTDYQCITSAPGTIPYGATGVQLSLTAYAQRVDIEITNNDANHTIYLTNMILRGYPLLGEESQQERWDQTTSFVPGEKVYPLRGNPYMQTKEQVGRVGPYLRDRLQKPRRLLSWRGPACPWLELLDRVAVSHHTMTPNPGLDLDAYVVGMAMGYTAGGLLTQELTLLPVSGVYANDDYFLLGTSAYLDAASDKAAY